MASDALTIAAEELAPARATTNFFDPTQGASVISRYAGAKIAAEGTAALGEATSRLNASRIDRAEARRRATMFDRDEREYAEKSDYKAQRGMFIDRVASIDPEADDYDEQISSLLKDLPMEVREDDALQALLTHKNRIADKTRTERDMQVRRQEQLEDRKELLKMRFENDPKLAALSPEERNQFYDPQTGEFDVYGARNLAYEKTRTDKKDDSKEMIDARTKASSEARAAKQTELDRRKSVMEVGVADQGAFPSQMAMLMKKYPKMTEADIEAEYPQEYLFAKSYEDKKLNSEMATALASDKVEDYVNRFPNATEAQKKKRRDLWQLAHDMRGNAEPEAEATGEPTAAPAAGKPLDRETGMKFLQDAGGDKNKAREMARAAGYTF